MYHFQKIFKKKKILGWYLANLTIVWCRAFFPHVLSDIWQSCKHRESIQIGKFLVKIWHLLVLTTISEKSILNGLKSWKSESSNMTSTKNKTNSSFIWVFYDFIIFGFEPRDSTWFLKVNNSQKIFSCLQFLQTMNEKNSQFLP